MSVERATADLIRLWLGFGVRIQSHDEWEARAPAPTALHSYTVIEQRQYQSSDSQAALNFALFLHSGITLHAQLPIKLFNIAKPNEYFDKQQCQHHFAASAHRV